MSSKAKASSLLKRLSVDLSPPDNEPKDLGRPNRKSSLPTPVRFPHSPQTFTPVSATGQIEHRRSSLIPPEALSELQLNHCPSVASSFAFEPPTVCLTANITQPRGKHQGLAIVSISDEESATIVKPYTDLLETIGTYLEGPDAADGDGQKIIGELIDVDRLMKLHLSDASEGHAATLEAAKRKKARRLLGRKKIGMLNVWAGSSWLLQLTHSSTVERPVFGVELRTIYDYASVWMLVGHEPCKVPIVLIATVEQLYSRGMCPNPTAQVLTDTLA